MGAQAEYSLAFAGSVCGCDVMSPLFDGEKRKRRKEGFSRLNLAYLCLPGAVLHTSV